MTAALEGALGMLVPGVATQDAISRPALERRRPIPALTGLRFFAAFFILFAHATDWIGQFQNADVNRYLSFVAMYGMPLFFVLSGFVIHYNYRELFMKAGIARATCEFAAARFARLYPLYFCFFLFALGADDFVANAVHDPQQGWQVLAYYLTLTQSWWYLIYGGQSIIYQLFSVSWSISTEMYFYLLYAVLIFALLAVFRRGRAIAAGTIYACAVALTLWVVRYNLGAVVAAAQHFLPDYIDIQPNFEHSFYRWLFYFSPYVRVLEFFLGCFAAQAFIDHAEQRVSPHEYRLGRRALGLALVSLVIAGLLYLGVGRFRDTNVLNLTSIYAYTQFFALNFLCAPAIAVIMFCVARYDTGFARMLAAPLLVALGETSYSIYLVHTWTLRLFVHAPQPFTRFWAGEALFRIACGIGFTLLVSYGTYRLIELPGRVWVRAGLRRVIVRLFDRQMPAEATPPREPVRYSTRTQVVYTASILVVLALVAVCGQAARYEYVRTHLRRLVFGGAAEIQVLSATYGANCKEFRVPAPYPNLVSAGNATQAVREACNGRADCEFEVSQRLGDPANGCGKDFSVAYRCLGTDAGALSGFIPGEALGKSLILRCSAPAAAAR